MHLIAGCALILVAIGLAACGGDSIRRGDVIARVGPRSITKTELSHWMAVLASEHTVPDPPRYTACVAHKEAVAHQFKTATLAAECQQQYRALRQQVLDFLITKYWLIGEASDEHVGVSQQEVERRLGAKKKSYPNGDAEFKQSLKAIAQTVADVEFEIRAELAVEKIRQAMNARESRITQSEAYQYYRQHIHDYHIPERRFFDIVEFIPSATKARRIMKEIKQGKNIATMSLHEGLKRTNPSVQGIKRPLYEAIFVAKPNVLIGPVRVRLSYFVVQVTQILPSVLESFKQVRGSIQGKLAAAQQSQTLAKFIAAWRRRWIARTDCRPGYVVQKCRQYNGPVTSEDMSSFV